MIYISLNMHTVHPPPHFSHVHYNNSRLDIVVSCEGTLTSFLTHSFLVIPFPPGRLWQQISGFCLDVTTNFWRGKATQIHDILWSINQQPAINLGVCKPPQGLERQRQGSKTSMEAYSHTVQDNVLTVTSTLYSVSSVKIWAENSFPSMCACTREFSSPAST